MRPRARAAGVCRMALALWVGASGSACQKPPGVLPRPLPTGNLALRGEARALFTADPDGDGQDTLFLAFADELDEVTARGGRLDLVRRYRSAGATLVLASAGDVDGDGRDEVALTTLRPQVAGVLLRGAASPDDPGALIPSRPLPAWLRITELPAGDSLAPALVCETPSSEQPFHPPPVRCPADAGGRPHPEAPLDLPPGVDLDEFFYVRQPEAVALYSWDDDGRLTRRHGRQVLWRSEARWMTRPVSVERTFTSLMGEAETRLQSFVSEALVRDLDGDAVPDVVLPAADDAGFTVLARARFFRGGSFRIATPNGYGLQVRHQSPALGQAVVGVTLFDVDGDGTQELIAAAVTRPRAAPGGARSTLMAYDPRTAAERPLALLRPAAAVPGDGAPLPPPARSPPP